MHKEEIIGKMMEVTNARNTDLTGIKGKIVNETKNTVVADTTEGRKKIPKRGVTFNINGIEVKGEDLDARPEDRVKG